MPQNTLYSVHPTPPTQPAVGFSPRGYLDILAEPEILAKLPHGVPLAAHILHPFPLHAPLTRAQVRTICTDTRIDVLEAYAIAMAWGGQNRDHFRSSVIAPSLPKLLRQLRSGGNRLSDFDITQTAANHIKGLGISFYTKLLYFFRPTPDAYILDQWTAKSARLLFNPCQISLNYELPDPDTTPAQYEWFCAQLDNFAPILWPTIAPVTGEDAEVAIFDEGYGHGEWRKYVVAHFKNGAVAKAIREGAECLTTHQDYDDGWLVIRVPSGLEIHVVGLKGGAGNALRVLLARIRELRPTRIFFPAVQGGIPLPDWFTNACHALGTELIVMVIEKTIGDDNDDAPDDEITNPDLPTIYVQVRGGPDAYYKICLEIDSENIGYISKRGGARAGEVCVYNILNNLRSPNYLGIHGPFNVHLGMRHQGPVGNHAGNISVNAVNVGPYGWGAAGIGFLRKHFNVVLV